MPLGVQIRKLADRVLDDLQERRAYYEHTKAAWRVTQQFAAAGHSINIRNMLTGDVLKGADLDGLAQRYVTVHLAQSQ